MTLVESVTLVCSLKCVVFSKLHPKQRILLWQAAEGPNSDDDFLVHDEGREDSNNAKRGP